MKTDSNSKFNKIKFPIPVRTKGFTLAEVLVSLGLLGILSVVLIPTLYKSIPKENKVLYKKAYGVVSKNVNNMAHDLVSYPDDDKVFATAAGYDVAFCKKFLSYLNVTDSDETYCSGGSGSTSSGYKASFATTTDGMKWYFFSLATVPTSDNYYYLKLVIDTNGDKKPNCQVYKASHCNQFTTAGHTCYGNNNYASCPKPDTFMIGVNRKGQLMIGNSSWNPDSVYETYDVNIMSNPYNFK